MMGTLKLSATVASFRRQDRSLILGGPSRARSGSVSISSEADDFEASSASAMSKNLFRRSMEGKLRRSTLWSFAACLATFLSLQITAMISNFLRSFLRFLISSFGVCGFRSTRVAKSRPFSVHGSRIWFI